MAKFRHRFVIVSFVKRNALLTRLRHHLDFYDAEYVEHVDFVVNFILLSAKDYLLNPSLLEEVNVLLSVINPVALRRAESNYLSKEVRTCTALSIDPNRITLSEQGQSEHGFITFVAAYPNSMSYLIWILFVLRLTYYGHALVERLHA